MWFNVAVNLELFKTYFAHGLFCVAIALVCAAALFWLLFTTGVQWLSGLAIFFFLFGVVALMAALIYFCASLFYDDRRRKIGSAIILLVPILLIVVPKAQYFLFHQSNIAFQELQYDQSCFRFEHFSPKYPFWNPNGPVLPGAQVIANESDYQKLLQYSIQNEGSQYSMYDQSQCFVRILPSIDFETTILLGVFSENSACDPKWFVKTVQLDAANKRLVYTVDNGNYWFQSCSRNKPLFSMNWITVPRVSNDYSVHFVTGALTQIFTFDNSEQKWVQTGQSNRRD